MRRVILLAFLTLLPAFLAAAQTLYVKKTGDGYLNLRDGPAMSQFEIRQDRSASG